MTCYGITNGRTWTQEVYETASRDAGRRTRQLRKAGYVANSFPMGSQATPVGTIKLTMVTIQNPDDNTPMPENVERL